jgi:hypothetical protein
MQANWVICVELDGCDNWQTSESSTVKAVIVLKFSMPPFFLLLKFLRFSPDGPILQISASVY